MNRTLYPTILATITDETVRLKMQEGTDGDCVSLMLKCIARYGVNPAAQHIANAKKYGELPKFVDPEEKKFKRKRRRLRKEAEKANTEKGSFPCKKENIKGKQKRLHAFEKKK